MENNKKRKGGRPKVLVKREERIQVRTTKLEKRVIETTADQVGLSVSDFLRKLAFDLQVKERFSPEELDLFRSLQKYSSGFASISNYIKNTQGISPQFLADIDQLRKDIHSVVKKFK